MSMIPSDDVLIELIDVTLCEDTLAMPERAVSPLRWVRARLRSVGREVAELEARIERAMAALAGDEPAGEGRSS